MPPKRGLSLEEKRQKLLAIFHTTKDVFVLKDIEKLGTKEGIVTQSIPEVLQSLCDDDMVHKERIGASNYYWAFPGEAAAKLDASNVNMQKQSDALEQDENKLQKQLEAAQEAQPDAAELAPKVRVMKALEEKSAFIKTTLGQYADCDPERFRELNNGAQTCHEQANTWLDNIECLRSYLKKANEGREEDINEFFTQSGVKGMDWLD